MVSKNGSVNCVIPHSRLYWEQQKCKHKFVLLLLLLLLLLMLCELFIVFVVVFGFFLWCSLFHRCCCCCCFISLETALHIEQQTECCSCWRWNGKRYMLAMPIAPLYIFACFRTYDDVLEKLWSIYFAVCVRILPFLLLCCVVILRAGNWCSLAQRMNWILLFIAQHFTKFLLCMCKYRWSIWVFKYVT